MELFLNGEPIDSQYVDANDGLNFNQFKNEKIADRQLSAGAGKERVYRCDRRSLQRSQG